MSDDTKREYEHRHKWEHYAADIVALLSELAYDLRGVLTKAQPQLFDSKKFLKTWTFTTDDERHRVDDEERELTDEEKEQWMRRSKAAWFGLCGLNIEA